MQYEELERKTEFLLDIVNLLEINKIIPKEIIERAMNRMAINGLREQLKEGHSDEINNKLKKCLEREMKYQNKNNFFAKIFRRFHE